MSTISALARLSPLPASATVPCRSHDPDLWFAESPVELERAKMLCRGCPVRARCLAAAQQRSEPWGVWGGEILDRGTVVPVKRARGRPPRHPEARRLLLHVPAPEP